ncbi:MAG: PAS domain S-box protein, partial [Ginsengibacter sp.]
MFLWWGPDLICFYNDAYRPSLGENGKHPDILGMKAEKAWPEIWDTIKPLIDQVLAGGEATWNEDQLIPIYRNGKIEDVYWTFSYSPVYDEPSRVTGVLVTCNETTEKVNIIKRLEESDKRFRNTVKQAPFGITILRGSEFFVEMANDAYLQVVDRKEAEFVGKPLFESLPEVEETVRPLLDHVLNTGIPFHGVEYPIPVNRNGKKELSYFDFLYYPLKEDDGTISGIMVTVTDVSAGVNAKHSLAESELQFRNMVMQSPIAMTIFRGEDFVIEMANTTMFKKIWRKKENDVLGKKLLDVFPELNSQKYPELLHKVYSTRQAHRENESIAYVQGDDGLKKFYLDFEYNPLFETDRSVSGIMITLNDVTEKVEARQLLKESSERLTLATEGTQLATWDLNLQTFDIIHSPRLSPIFGYSDETKILTHAQLREHIHPDDRHNIVEKAFDNALQTGIYYYQARIIHPDKTIHWIRTHGKVIFDDTRLPVRMLGTVIDITESQITHENAEKMAAIVHSSDDAIISKNMNGIITTWNTGAERIFGYAAKEMIGQPIIKLIPADKTEEESNILSRLKRGERVDHFETKRITKDKKIIDVSLTISPIRDINGNIIGASKIARDVTKQKDAEKMILASEQKFRLLADSMPQFIWTGDAQGNLNYFNKSVYNFAGLTTEQIDQDGWMQIVHPEDREENMRIWMDSVHSGRNFIFEHRFRRDDGEYRWQLSRAIPQKDDDGNIQMWVGTSTDIHEIKELDQQKDYFISMASHELKTPVTSIKGYIQILQSKYENTSDAFLKKSLDTVNNQIVKLTNLISDLLDLSKIKTGSLVLHRENFRINELIQEVIEEMKHINPGYNFIFSNETDILINADRERISQVLINFLTNAVKYSPKCDNIKIASVVEQNNVVVSVEDCGIGINRKDQEKIFERFYRVEGKNEKTFPGFGIGLFIAMGIIERHSGRIGVKSEPGKGSVFYFSIPIINPS